tara:strand:+ start:17951 stop:19117 length:1167 start_codon:yes stop_codon:yes gene_type:complete
MSQESKQSKTNKSEIYISSQKDEDGTLEFTLKGVNVSIANAIRRVILSDIPILGFKGFPYEKNDINIEHNTTRLNNEIIKQRISCIPVNRLKINDPYEKLIFEIDKENTSDNIEYVTTEHFKIKDSETDKYLEDELVKKIFPPDQITNDFIIITRLLPKISQGKPGEKIKLTAKLSINTAGEDGVYNVTSCCSYMNSPDKIRQDDVWNEILKNLSDEDKEPDKLKIKKSDWINHNSKRIFIPDSFDFKITSVGIFNNIDIVRQACNIIINRVNELKNNISSPEKFAQMLQSNSNSTISDSFDIVLFNEDYTIGKIIEYVLHYTYYKSEKILSYVGFRKNHPHDSYSIIRIAFKDNIPSENIYQSVQTVLANSCDKAISIYQNILETFD